METRAGGLAPTPPAWRRVAERLTDWRPPGCEDFYQALASHFARLCDHPVPHRSRERQASLLDHEPAFWMVLARRA